MDTRQLSPMEATSLFRLAEELADVIGEGEWDFEPHIEPALRADLAAATFSRAAYMAILYGGDRDVSKTFLAQAKDRRDRTERHLRFRVAGVLAHIGLCDIELSNVAEQLLSATV